MMSHVVRNFDKPKLLGLTLLIISTLKVTVTHAQFTDVSETLGFSGGGKAAFADYDGDGWVDLFAGQLFHNEQGNRLTPVAESGLPGGEAIWGDFDNDGHLDALMGNDGQPNELYRCRLPRPRLARAPFARPPFARAPWQG